MTIATRVLAAVALAGALVSTTSGQVVRKPRLPFQCFTNEWLTAFKVQPATYDAKAFKVTWQLEAKKDAKPPRYEAFLSNGDGVEVGTVDVTLSVVGDIKAKAKVVATVSLANVDAAEVSKVQIRERK